MKSSRNGCSLSVLRKGFMDRRNGYYKKVDRNSKRKLFIKAFLCVVGIVVLAIIASNYRDYRIKEGKEPYVRREEVLPVLETFIEIENEKNETGSAIREEATVENIISAGDGMSGQDYLTYGELLGIVECFPVDDLSCLEDYKKPDWYVGLADWNGIVLQMVDRYGGDAISVQEQLILGNEAHITDEDGNTLSSGNVLTAMAVYENQYWNMEEYLFCKVSALCYKNRIVTVIGMVEGEGCIENAFMVDSSQEEMHVFWKGYHLRYPIGCIEEKTQNGLAEGITGKIIDMGLNKGKISIQREKDEYIHGKLLQMTDDAMEIEDCGIFPMDEEMAIYRLYGELKSKGKSDLKIGYSFTDFVIEDGEIVACLMIKEEDMDYIRVLLKNSNMEGRYHQSVLAYCSQDCDVIRYKNGVMAEKKRVLQGEEIWVEPDDLETEGERLKIVPVVLSATTTVESISRNQGIPAYHGTLEITRKEDGLLIINEVLLEDYLCRVVPSEMPASYPKEALMAQAICARTYAYGKMLKTGLPDLGAHVDDSAGFQVYNNINEQISTTEAVRATHNTIAVYEEEPIGAYYYSTSCGIGTDTSIWHGGGESPEYLQSLEIGSSTLEDTEQSMGEWLMEEDNFREWITAKDSSHYEADEGWYRWTYEIEQIDVELIKEVLERRYANNPNLILTKNKNGDFESKEIKELGDILDIRITVRNVGGVADEMVIIGTKAVIKVISELNIRYVLADGVTQVLRQSGDTPAASASLPSAYIVIDTIKEDETVTGYVITGGGFGHGVGMSQNGAANMAKSGMTCEEIIGFFYPQTTLKTLQFGD